MSTAILTCEVCKARHRSREGLFTTGTSNLSLVGDSCGCCVWATTRCPRGHAVSKLLNDAQVEQLLEYGAVAANDLLSREADAWLQGVRA